MSGLLFLTSGDFNVQRGSKGPILCHGIKGYSLIMFYSTHCPKCQTMIPVFKRLPGTIGGCQFGMVNVGNNRKCIEMAKQTVTPIQYVPLIILYINGKPFMRYPAERPGTIENLQKFVIEIAENVRQKQQFTRSKADTPINAEDLGNLFKGIGIPVCSGGVCYLPNSDAYPTQLTV